MGTAWRSAPARRGWGSNLRFVGLRRFRAGGLEGSAPDASKARAAHELVISVGCGQRNGLHRRVQAGAPAEVGWTFIPGIVVHSPSG